MTMAQTAFAAIMLSIYIYVVVNRICECIEHCALLKAYNNTTGGDSDGTCGKSQGDAEREEKDSHL